MNQPNRILNYFWMFLGGASLNFAICALLLLFLKDYISLLDDYAYWTMIVGLLVALSVIGKNIQLIGWITYTVSSGVRTALFFSDHGPLVELSPVYCTVAIIITIALMVYNGRKKPVDSDEWLIAIFTLVQLTVIALLRANFS